MKLSVGDYLFTHDLNDGIEGLASQYYQAHKIVKVTPKRVYIDVFPDSPGLEQVIVGRLALEEKGEAWCPGRGSTIQTSNFLLDDFRLLSSGFLKSSAASPFLASASSGERGLRAELALFHVLNFLFQSGMHQPDFRLRCKLSLQYLALQILFGDLCHSPIV